MKITHLILTRNFAGSERYAMELALDSLPRGRRSLILPAQAETYARELYSSLRRFDELKARQILIEQMPSSIEWPTLIDRIKRAIFGSSP